MLLYVALLTKFRSNPPFPEIIHDLGTHQRAFLYSYNKFQVWFSQIERLKLIKAFSHVWLILYIINMYIRTYTTYIMYHNKLSIDFVDVCGELLLE